MSISDFLRRVSLGRYPMKLYHRGTAYYTTALGGVLTIIIVIALIVYSSILLADTFNRKHYSLDKSSRQLPPTNFDDTLKIKDVALSMSQYNIYLNPKGFTSKEQVKCSSYFLNVTIWDPKLKSFDSIGLFKFNDDKKFC